MYLTSPGYPLPLSHFSAPELHALETKSPPALIARCGFNRNTSRVVLYGPARLNGGSLRPFATEQGVAQVQYLYKHWSSSLQLNSAQRIAVSWAQLHTGVGWSILYDVNTPLPHFVESHWLRSLRDFLHSIQGQLRLDATYVPALQRDYDSFIMDHVLQSQLFTARQIQRINYCRLFLQVVTISDMTNASGNRLFQGMLSGNTTDILSETTWHHTHQGRPNPATWKLWRRACALFSTKGVLHDSLDEWLLPAAQQRRQWPHYFDPTTDTILCRDNDHFTIHYKS
jgi:hypothetical protein